MHADVHAPQEVASIWAEAARLPGLFASIWAETLRFPGVLTSI